MQSSSSSVDKKMPLHIKMLFGFAVGIAAGVLAHIYAFEQPWVTTLIEWVTRPAGDIFLRLLFMLVIPLLFSALVLGVAELGDLRKLGRIGWRTLAYTVLVSSLAVLIGVGLVNLIRPGDGIDAATRTELLTGAAERAAQEGIARPLEAAALDEAGGRREDGAGFDEVHLLIMAKPRALREPLAV